MLRDEQESILICMYMYIYKDDVTVVFILLAQLS